MRKLERAIELLLECSKETGRSTTVKKPENLKTRELHRFFEIALDFGHTPLLLVPEVNQKLLISRNEEDPQEIIVAELVE